MLLIYTEIFELLFFLVDQQNNNHKKCIQKNIILI